jgi:hypothetical protein
MTKNSKKFTAGKLFYIFLIKNCNKLSLGQKASKLQEMPSALKRKHPAHENSLLFSIFVGYLCPLDPDPDPATQINADPCGSR